jgi:hypothetical protein
MTYGKRKEQNLMKSKKNFYIFMFLVFTILNTQLFSSEHQSTFAKNKKSPDSSIMNNVKKGPDGLENTQSCTIFYASNQKTTLAGNNEDWNNPFTKIWFLPAKNGKYGRVYFGFDSFMPQGGMNDQGLFFDAAVAEHVEVPHDPNKLPFKGSLILKAMAECSKVEEVLTLFKTYDVSGGWNGHYLIGDRYGDSAIIEPQTFIRKNGTYQLITNFLQSKIKPENATCLRFHIASELLKNSKNPTVELFRRILDSVHYENPEGINTLYSNIYDLKNGLIYLYNFHNYQNVVVLNLKKELAKGMHIYELPSLFPVTFSSTRFIRYKTEEFTKLLKEKVDIKGIDPQIFNIYTGKYKVTDDMEFPQGSSIELALIDNQLTMMIADDYNLREFKLYPTSENEFIHIFSSGDGFFTVSFTKDEKENRITMNYKKEGKLFSLNKL